MAFSKSQNGTENGAENRTENRMELKEDLIRFVKGKTLSSEHSHFFREPLTGFASAEDPLFSQLPEIVGKHHIHPRDLLPEAKTVMVFFLPFASWIIAANRKSSEVAGEWALAYINTNRLLNAISEGLVSRLARKGIPAEMVRATHTYDSETLLAPWSHRSAAFIAGLGRFGLNRMLITSKGCGGRYSSIVFAKAVPFDRRHGEEHCLALRGGNCRYCVEHCPTGALSPEKFDRHRCNRHLIETSKNFTDLGLCDCCGKCVVGPCAVLENR
jgi:epoxyqueuosine reductase QueG